jgi:hypothetical protein
MKTVHIGGTLRQIIRPEQLFSGKSGRFSLRAGVLSEPEAEVSANFLA